MIKWTGNLKDDCKSEWKGLHLHAEEMDKNYWWWSVSDYNQEIIESSNDGEIKYKNGKSARLAAEKSARQYLNI